MVASAIANGTFNILASVDTPAAIIDKIASVAKKQTIFDEDSDLSRYERIIAVIIRIIIIKMIFL